MSKHTPGPWVVTPHPMTNVDVFGVGVIMDDKEMQYGLSHTFCYQNAEANARLIAAAPDLLIKLTGLIGAAEYLQARVVETRGADCMDNLDVAIDEARAAIAKATGGAQ